MYRTEENPPLYRWKIFETYSQYINTGITCRTGGISRGLYENFNQALHCGDDDQTVISNRKILCRALNIPFSRYTCAEQSHSANLMMVEETNCGNGRNNYKNSIKNTDAFITDKKNILLNIHTADCVPVVIFDFKNKIGAVIHAGWKGTAQLITLKTVKYMIDKLNCKPEFIIAGLGPSIGSCCFEIGSETAEKLRKNFNYSQEVLFSENNTYKADLALANREQLRQAGVAGDRIELSQICTSCQNDEFYSYRASKGMTGRFTAFMFLR